MKKIGRPPKSEDEKQTSVIRVRCTEAESRAVRQAAKVSGKSLSAWTRETVIRAARRKLRRG